MLILILTKQSSYLLGRGKTVNHYNQFGVVFSSSVLRPPHACSLEVEFFTNNWPLDSWEASQLMKTKQKTVQQVGNVYGCWLLCGSLPLDGQRLKIDFQHSRTQVALFGSLCRSWVVWHRVTAECQQHAGTWRLTRTAFDTAFLCKLFPC